MARSFNKAYKQEGFYWGLQPNEIVKEALLHAEKKPGNALDIGGGEGRDAMFLASNGFRVLVVDKAKEGLKKARSLANKNHLHIKTRYANIPKFQIPGKFDIISCCNALQFLEPRDAYSMIREIRGHTNKKGLNIIRAFSERNPEKHFPFLLKSKELLDLYENAGWQIIKYEEFLTPYESHTGAPLHQHGIAQIIAKKK